LGIVRGLYNTPNFIKRNFKIEDMVKISIITLSKRMGVDLDFPFLRRRYCPTGGKGGCIPE